MMRSHLYLLGEAALPPWLKRRISASNVVGLQLAELEASALLPKS